MLEDEELEKQNQTLGFGDRLDKGLTKLGLGKKNYIERTKASNLKDLGMLDRKFGLPTITTGLIDAFDVPKETAMFDIDSIREIARVGRGVKVMSVDEKEKVVAVALHNEDDEEKNSDLNSSEDNDE